MICAEYEYKHVPHYVIQRDPVHMWCVLCRVSYQYFQVTMLTHFLTLCKKLRGKSALVIETNHHCLCLVL